MCRISAFFFFPACKLSPSVVPTLCDPMDCGPPGSSVHRISQVGILKWVANSYSRVSSRPRDRTHISCMASRFLTTGLPGKPHPFFHFYFSLGEGILSSFQEDQKLSDTQPSSPLPSFYFALLYWNMTGY